MLRFNMFYDGIQVKKYAFNFYIDYNLRVHFKKSLNLA